jgi:hypothetical protein
MGFDGGSFNIKETYRYSMQKIIFKYYFLIEYWIKKITVFLSVTSAIIAVFLTYLGYINLMQTLVIIFTMMLPYLLIYNIFIRSFLFKKVTKQLHNIKIENE